MPVKYADRQLAFGFVSDDGFVDHQAFVDRQSGTIYRHSEDGGLDEELPDEIERYVEIPGKGDAASWTRLLRRRGRTLRFVGQPNQGGDPR